MNATAQQPFRGLGRLQNVVAELRRQVEARVDFVVDSSDLSVVAAPVAGADGKPTHELRLVPGPGARDFLPAAGLPMLDQTVQQFAERMTPRMPIRYLREALAEVPALFAGYVTEVIRAKSKRWFVRCLDGRVRALLSNSFKVIESLDVVEAVLAGAQDRYCRVLKASVSDSHVRITLVSPSVWAALDAMPADHQWLKPPVPGGRMNSEWARRVGFDPTGLPMQGGPTTLWPTVEFGNSETGHGRYFGSVGILQAACCNLATVSEEVARVHLGGRMDVGIFSAETVTAEAKLIALQTRDLIGVAFDSEKFRALVAEAARSDGVAVSAPATAAKNVIRLGRGLAEADLDALVRAFGDERQTVWGVGQAVARLAQDAVDPEVARDREVLAGEVLVGKHTAAILAAD